MKEEYMQDDCCSEVKVHEELLKIVNDTMPEETELYDLAELFKVFSSRIADRSSSDTSSMKV